MNINLNDHFENFIEERIKSGQYNSASEVVRDALRLLEEQEQIRAMKMQALKAEIQKGLDDLQQGRYSTYSDETLGEFFEDVKKRGRERLAAKKKRS